MAKWLTLIFDHFVAKHFESAIHREELTDALWNTGMVGDLEPEVIARFDEVMEEAREVAKEVGMRLEIHPRRMHHDGMCLVRPATNLFVDYEGRVSSCCYLNKNDVMRYLAPEERPKDDGIYGDLRVGDLMDFLGSDRYKAFQREWLEGGVPEACSGCIQVRRIHTSPE